MQPYQPQDQTGYGVPYQGYPQAQQPVSDPGVGYYPVSAPAAPASRKPSGAVLGCVVLGICLVLSLVGGVAAYASASSRAGRQSSRADELKRQVDAHKATDDQSRRRFADDKFDDKYAKVRDADTAEQRAFEQWLRSTDAESKSLYTAWNTAIFACLREVTVYNRAAQAYPKDWFGPAPATIDLSNQDTNCYSAKG